MHPIFPGMTPVFLSPMSIQNNPILSAMRAATLKRFASSLSAPTSTNMELTALEGRIRTLRNRAAKSAESASETARDAGPSTVAEAEARLRALGA